MAMLQLLVRPIFSPSSSIIDFNEKEESIKISGYLGMAWYDDFLKWNPTDYGGLGRLLFILEATCDVDITYFPFDTQECPLKFSAWSYTIDEVIMIEGEKGIITEQFEENSRWSLVNTTVEEVKGVDAMVIFKMKLKRKSTFYVFNILIPMVLLSFLNVLTFVLSVQSGERASYAVTVFLSLAVFLTIVASEIPKNSNTISIVSVYMTAVLALSIATVMTSLLELRLASRAKDKDLISSGYMILEATCDVDITYFPFDTQECPLKFSAWSYTIDEVVMIEGEKGIYLKEFDENLR
ncbi:neuronal acetylcholine receptor subunit alpha-9-like [Dreissena polymorpha]|uniref:neuronal acetylcholine receptor subunit alpha-9-like n=1 Tax=Dreissena polymorpha TaxID=45954 RepID=UPI002263D630|nr:neuronal acetylcholine receptor subunit alpha-9-like [Dreissena polymorpha]